MNPSLDAIVPTNLRVLISTEIRAPDWQATIDSKYFNGFYTDSAGPGGIHVAPGSTDPDFRDADSGSNVQAQSVLGAIYSWPLGLPVPNPLATTMMVPSTFANGYSLNRSASVSTVSDVVILSQPLKRFYTDFDVPPAVPPYTVVVGAGNIGEPVVSCLAPPVPVGQPICLAGYPRLLQPLRIPSAVTAFRLTAPGAGSGVPAFPIFDGQLLQVDASYVMTPGGAASSVAFDFSSTTGQLGGPLRRIVEPGGQSLPGLPAFAQLLRRDVFPVGSAPPLPGATVTSPSPAANDLAGSSVAVSETVLVVGVPGSNSSSGLVLVYDRSASSGGFGPQVGGRDSVAFVRTEDWGSKPSMVLSPDSVGAIGDKFGASVGVSPDGTTIVVGSPGANVGAGQVRVYRRPGSTWNNTLPVAPVATLSPTVTGGVTAVAFGTSVDIDASSNIVVGAPDSTVGGSGGAGSAYAYRDTGTTVVPNGPAVIAPNPQLGGQFGTAVGVDAGIVAVGAPRQDVTEVDSGAAYVFSPTTQGGGGGFQPVLTLICQGGGGLGDKYGCGTSIAIDGDTVVVGAPGADSPTGEEDAGVAEVFRTSEPPLVALATAPSVGASYSRVTILRPTVGVRQRAGTAVSLGRAAVVLGAPTASITQDDQGRAYVYDRSEVGFAAGDVSPNAILGSATNGLGDKYGRAVALSSRNLVVGVPNSSAYSQAGVATPNAGRGDTYVFDLILRSGHEGSAEAP